MLAIAGQTAEPNWLTFIVKTHGTLGVTQTEKNIEFFKITSKCLLV